MVHIIRLARTGLFLVVSLLALGVVGGFVYLNQVGFPGRYGEWLREELGNRGVHLSFETLRFDLNRGFVATEVSFFQDEDQKIPLLKAQEITLDLDKTKALRGEFEFLGLKIVKGTAQVPIDEEGRLVTASEIDGELNITSTGRAVLSKTSGLIEGIRINISADLKLKEASKNQAPPEDSRQVSKLLSIFVNELALWNLPSDTPPEITFHVEGDLNDPLRLQTSFRLTAENLGRNNYQLERLILVGDLRAQVITLDEILLQDETGSISGQADWSLARRDGRLDLVSNLHIQDLFNNCFTISVLDDLKITSPPVIKLHGNYTISENEQFSLQATGHIDVNDLEYQETSFKNLSSDFSWHDGNLYLRDLEVAYQEKLLHGNLLINDENIRFDFHSTLPLEAFKPVIKPESGLERALRQLTFSKSSVAEVDVIGTINRHDRKIWSATGKAKLRNFTYKGTKVHRLSTDYQLSREQAGFANVEALLNDDRENARARMKGKASGEIYADRILFESASRFTTISNLRGTVWPTPIVRIFAPKVAKHIEDNYRFHKTPQLTLNGRFAGRKKDLGMTSFSVALRTKGKTDYPFLGSDLPLENLQADIIVRGTEITIKNLAALTLDGNLSGSVFCDVNPAQKTKYRGAIKWNQISFKRLSQVYEFDEEEKGQLTGSIDFRGSEGNVRNFNGDGIVAINGGNLVSLPVFGPLSPIMAGLLGDKRVGYERAKDASAHFAIQNGVLQTKDFVAISTSITLTGEGKVDLLTDKINMIIRVNARGLLGLLTFPLQPLKGIFQFRGTGIYSDPKWSSAPFTRPARGKNDPIFQAPGKATLVPE